MHTHTQLLVVFFFTPDTDSKAIFRLKQVLPKRVPPHSYSWVVWVYGDSVAMKIEKKQKTPTNLYLLQNICTTADQQQQNVLPTIACLCAYF